MKKSKAFIEKYLPSYQDAGRVNKPELPPIDPSKLSREQYEALYNQGRVATYDPASGAYQPPMMEGITITADKPKSASDFFDRYNKKANTSADHLLEAMFTVPIDYITGLPQAAMSYMLDPEKSLTPSEALVTEQNNKRKHGGKISSIQKLGYKRNSPHKNRRSININSNLITMDGVDIPLMLVPDNDEPMVAPPNSGQYMFPNSSSVQEIPMGKYRLGGMPCMECGGMVKYQEGGYVIKKGDTLSKVSKETGIALQDIIAANNIKDPNKVQIGQSLVLPTSSVPQKKENIQINSDSNAYTIKKNDSLGAIAKKYNVSVQDLAKANNIENVNKIITGQKINIPTAASPYSNKELVKIYKEQKKKEDPKVPVTYDNKKLYKGLDESKINNEQVVLDHLKGKEPFVLIDKKTNTLKRYDKSGNIIGEMRVGLGSDKGDKFTINSKNKKVDRNTTPGGVYIVDERNPHESYRHLYDNNILLLKSQAGLRQATSIHQVPSGSVKRDQWLADNNLTNDDFSNGCINCNKEQFEKYLKTVGTGEKVVILPEEEGNYFAVKNGELSFTTNRNKEFGQYNFTPKSKEYRPLTYNFNTDTEVKSKYVDALKNEKKKLMKDLNLTSDEYDELAKRAYGILGQESSFGFGSFNPSRDYKIEKWYTLAADDPEERKRRSLGLSQVRLSNVDPKFAEKYGIDTKTLYYPYQAALATMNVLADGLQAVRNPKIRDQYENMTPENVYDYVTTFYNKPETVRRGEASGKNTYVQNVNRNYQASESQPAMAKIKQYQQGGTSDKPIEMTLPEFTVVSSNPTSPNYDTLRLLKNTEEAFNNQLYPIWTNSGKPKIKELPPESKGRAFYQPINNTMGVRMYNETLISQIPNKKDRELLEEAISPNARPLTDKELAQIESLYNKYATYPTPHSQDVLAELAHSLQLKVRGLGSHITKYKKDTKMVKAKDSDSPEYDKLYDIPNTIEHEAHTILEPQLERYTTGLKRYTLDVPNMTAEDYKKQYGGTVKSFLNKWLNR